MQMVFRELEVCKENTKPLSEAVANAWTSLQAELSMLEAHVPYPSPVPKATKKIK